MTRLAVVLVLVLTVACVSAFDDRERRAWSDSRPPPEEISSTRYAVALTTVDREEGGCTIVVAGTVPPSLSTLTYDDNGDFAQLGLDLTTDAFAQAPILAGAHDPVDFGAGTLAVADRDQVVGPELFDARTGEEGGPILRPAVDGTACTLAEPLDSLVFGLIDGEPDLVGVAGSQLVLFHDVKLDEQGMTWRPECYQCVLPGSAAHVAMATVDDNESEDIVVLVGEGPGAQLLVFTGAQVMANHQGPCGDPLWTIAPPGGQAFGPPIAVGDMDNNSLPEIAVGSPDWEGVHVAINVHAPAGEPTMVLEIGPHPEAGQFGASLAFGDFNDDADDLEQLAVGDPAADPELKTDAGKVTVYVLNLEDIDRPELDLSATLYDSETEPRQRFGRSLEVAEFKDRNGRFRDILVVGAAGEVFTYFKIFPGIADPRHP